ncbi:hypothetical protein RHMOL_Rhmol10G0249000 [Rhododendron molle]|uniref:Uncharacterized protein n=1 Tax=Rhododendron molle TaxID=49168 RepID=A0ACC0M6W9_RHOML|nr:hypothetical protein RHMOL_Rhmol10G0249000 [Rhododendron molle]
MACRDYAFENTLTQASDLNSTTIESSRVENLKSKLDLRDNDSKDGGHHVARLTKPMLRHTRSMRIRAFRESIAKEGGRHMTSPSKRRAHRRKSRFVDLDEAHCV